MTKSMFPMTRAQRRALIDAPITFQIIGTAGGCHRHGRAVRSDEETGRDDTLVPKDYVAALPPQREWVDSWILAN